MVKIEIKKRWRQDIYDVYIRHSGDTPDKEYRFSIGCDDGSLRYLIGKIAAVISNTRDDEYEIVCESDELKEKIADMYNELQSERVALEAVIDQTQTQIYEIDEQAEKILQTGLITKEVIESHRELNT